MQGKFQRFLRLFTRTSERTAPQVVEAPTPAAQVNQAVHSLNDEFVTLNFKLLELREALLTLRGALKELEAANRKRTETRQLLPAPGRLDLN